MEKSFDKIHLKEAAKMLSITNVNTMKEYGKKVSKRFIYFLVTAQCINTPNAFNFQRDWVLAAGDYYAFQIDVKKSDDSLNALELARQTVEYARELEMIV